jgi:2-polyprenyl-3-methyl-5-hydroxy-6-metoxy-1,4-benzoquinol methylase
MDRYQETFKTWNKLAILYQDKFMNLNLYNDTYDKFLRLVKKQNGLNVFEIGCGPGNICKYLLTKNPELKISAIDVSSNMIELAQRNNPSAQFLEMDIREISHLKKEYDGIICGFCIPYLSQSDTINLITHCKKLLKKSGILYLSFVEGDYSQSGYQVGTSGDKMYFYYHPLELLQETLQANCFQTEHLIHKQYTKADNTEEIHTIIIVSKISDN